MIAAEWIKGTLPRSWSVVRLRDHVIVINGYPFDSQLFSVDTGIPLVRIRDIASQETEVRYAGDIVPEALLSGGEILIGMDGDFNVARWKGAEALLNQRVCSVRPTRTVDARFLFYVLPAPLELINEFTYSTTVKHLSSFDVLKIRIPFPPLREQCAIADYLDRETARLDALVAAKERVIGLLAEKRRSLITRAVTRGLDPRAPLRDSGIPWLGEIPAHWDAIPLIWLTQPDRPIMYGIVLPGPDVGEGIPILKGGNVRPSRMYLESLARTTPEIEAPYARARLRASDLVYSIRGSICDCEIVPSELEDCNITQDVARVAPRSDVDAAWLRYALVCTPIREALAAGSLGAAVRGINICDLKRVRIPTPPPGEQALLVVHLTKTLTRMGMLAQATEQTIALIKERRAALIAAAVTGQIEIPEAIA